MIKHIFFLILLVSCATNIKNFEKYEKSPLLELEEMPSKEQVNNSLPRVVIVAEKPELEHVAKTNAHNVVKNSLTTLLETQMFASVVERNDNEAIAKEMKIAEFEGKPLSGMSSVDYVIKVDVSTITFSRQHKTNFAAVAANVGTTVAIAGASSRNNGGIYFAGANPNLSTTQYEYTSSIDGTIKIYEIPSMKMLKIIPLKATASESEVASTTSGFNAGFISFTDQKPIDSKSEDGNLAYEAIQDAIDNAIPEVKRFIKKSAYILEKRVYQSKAIYAINRGSNQGFRAEDKLSIYRIESERNNLTDEDDSVEQLVCKGVVAKNTLQKERGWAVFDSKCQDKIRLGDKASVEY